MKIFLLTPFFDNVFTQQQVDAMKNIAKLIVIKHPKPLSEIKELFTNEDDKLLALDPDFCNWSFPDKYFETIPNLKIICLKTTSFSWLNIEKAKSKNIIVINNKGWAVQSVVEWIIMTSLFLARRMPLMIKDGWKKNFDKYQGVELKGKVAGILGLGKNGRRLAETCNSLGMKVVYWSRKSKDGRFNYLSIPEIITQSDFIFPVWANNEETKKLLSPALIKKVKSSAIWVDIYIAQDTHDRKTLIELVKQKKLFGYGFEAEAKEFNKYSGNIAAIPESAWATKESIIRNTQQWVENIINAVKGKFNNKV